MTVLVGVHCSDGIVIGADSVATSAAGPSPLIHIQSVNKIHIFGNSTIVASTGAVGLSQRLIHHVGQAVDGGVFKNLNINDCTTNIARRFLKDAENSMVQSRPQVGIQFGALMASVIKGTPCLVEYSSIDFQPEIKKDQLFFVSMGSGQVLADPFLAFVSRVLWGGKSPSVDDAKFGVYWALRHTIKLAPVALGSPLGLLRFNKEIVNGLRKRPQTLRSKSSSLMKWKVSLRRRPPCGMS